MTDPDCETTMKNSFVGLIDGPANYKYRKRSRIINGFAIFSAALLLIVLLVEREVNVPLALSLLIFFSTGSRTRSKLNFYENEILVEKENGCTRIVMPDIAKVNENKYTYTFETKGKVRLKNKRKDNMNQLILKGRWHSSIRDENGELVTKVKKVGYVLLFISENQFTAFQEALGLNN